MKSKTNIVSAIIIPGLIMLILSSCSSNPKAERKLSVTFSMDCENEEEVKQIMEARIHSFYGENAAPKFISAGPHQVTIELNTDGDIEELKQLLQLRGKIEFWQTGQFIDIKDIMTEINDSVIILDAENWSHEEDSDKENATVLSDTIVSGIESMADEQIEIQRLNPFLSLFKADPNLVAKISDTAQINTWLKHPSVIKTIPENIKLLWGTKNSYYDTTWIELVILTGEPGPAITGKEIEGARVDFNSGNSKPEIEITFNNKGTKDFARITRTNINKNIAIVMDGKILSNPRVNGEVPNGKAVISGSFSLDEARLLATLLSPKKWECDVKILSSTEGK